MAHILILSTTIIPLGYFLFNNGSSWPHTTCCIYALERSADSFSRTGSTFQLGSNLFRTLSRCGFGWFNLFSFHCIFVWDLDPCVHQNIHKNYLIPHLQMFVVWYIGQFLFPSNYWICLFNCSLSFSVGNLIEILAVTLFVLRFWIPAFLSFIQSLVLCLSVMSHNLCWYIFNIKLFCSNNCRFDHVMAWSNCTAWGIKQFVSFILEMKMKLI